MFNTVMPTASASHSFAYDMERKVDVNTHVKRKIETSDINTRNGDDLLCEYVHSVSLLF